MNEKLKNLAVKGKEAITATTTLVGDLNGDGKADHEDAKIAVEWARRQAKAVGNEAAKLGKGAMASDMVKDAAAGAAVGAAIAAPVPGIGPIAGAAVGAGLGIYKNLTKMESSQPVPKQIPEVAIDVHAELLKFDELRQKGVITEAEFEEQKKRLLK